MTSGGQIRGKQYTKLYKDWVFLGIEYVMVVKEDLTFQILITSTVNHILQ